MLHKRSLKVASITEEIKGKSFEFELIRHVISRDKKGKNGLQPYFNLFFLLSYPSYHDVSHNLI
jgi:hypothetical protein